VARSFIEKACAEAAGFGGILHDGVAQMAEPASPKAWLLEPEEESLRKINDLGARSRSSTHAFIFSTTPWKSQGCTSLWFGANNTTKSYDNEKN